MVLLHSQSICVISVLRLFRHVFILSLIKPNDFGVVKFFPRVHFQQVVMVDVENYPGFSLSLNIVVGVFFEVLCHESIYVHLREMEGIYFIML